MMELEALTILRWAHGGDAVAIPETGPLAGMIVFVPNAVPGDVVRVRVVEQAPRFARAEVVAVVTPSPERVTPPCAVQAACGGCPWMIGSAAAQAGSRRAILAGEVKKRLGPAAEGVTIELHDGERQGAFGYRQRVRWTYADRQIGYVARGSHRLVPITDCAVADPRLTALLPALREALPAGESGKVTLLAGREGVAGWIQPAAGGAGAAVGRFFGRESVTVAFGTGAGTFSQVLSPRSFVQANAAVTTRILEDLRAVVRALPGRRAVELFAGSGTLTQVLWSEGYAVTAYEVDSAAASAFHATRERMGVGPERGRWCTNDLMVTGVPQRLDSVPGASSHTPTSQGDGAPDTQPSPSGPPDLVLLDPPRTGAKALVPWLRGTLAPTIVYVSCDLATALRDVAELCGTAAGTRGRRLYDVTRLVAYDMFPHTGHQELMLVLTRREGAR